MPHHYENSTPFYKDLSTQEIDTMIHDMMQSEQELDMEQVDAILRELNSRKDCCISCAAIFFEMSRNNEMLLVK